MDGYENGRANLAVRPSIPIKRLDEIQIGSETSYLIKGLIPRESINVLYGPPASGKSFLTLDMMMHVVWGEPYRSRKVQQGAIVYLAAEGASGFASRVEALRVRFPDRFSDPGLPFYLCDETVDLTKNYAALIDSIVTSTGGASIGAVVIDTLNRTLSGSENSDEDMAAYIAAADAIRIAFRCAVIIVHHSGKDRKGPRGHSSLQGAADVVIRVNKRGSGEIVATVEKMKDGPDGFQWISTLETVDLGIDADGDVVESCVVVEVESLSAKPTARSLPQKQIAMLQILEAVGEDGMSVEDWYSAARDIGIGKTRAADLSETRKKLAARGLVRNEGDRWYAEETAELA